MAGPKPITGALAPLASELGPHLTSAGYSAAPVSGSMGRAMLVGNMSVPQGWTQAAPGDPRRRAGAVHRIGSCPRVAALAGRRRAASSARWRCRAWPDGPSPPARPARSAVPRSRRHWAESSPRPTPPQPPFSSSRRLKTDKARVFDMFYAAFPPEINSGRMYTGAGSEPLLAAAAAWDELANELQQAAASYSSVISSLTSGPWLGPTSLSMAAAIAPYLTWMQSTATQAAETAGQAQRGRQRLRDGVRVTCAAGRNRRQPYAIGAARRDQHRRPEQCGDRGHRGPVRRDVGAGRPGDGHLRSLVGGRLQADAVHRTAPTTNRRYRSAIGGGGSSRCQPRPGPALKPLRTQRHTAVRHCCNGWPISAPTTPAPSMAY